MNDDYKVFFSGDCRRDGGPISYAFLVVDAITGDAIHEAGLSGQDEAGNTVHLAQYKAVLSALIWLYKNNRHKGRFIRFLGSSELVFEEMSKEHVAGEYSHKEVAVRCLTAINEHFWMVDFELIPEDDNPALDLPRNKILETT